MELSLVRDVKNDPVIQAKRNCCLILLMIGEMIPNVCDPLVYLFLQLLCLSHFFFCRPLLPLSRPSPPLSPPPPGPFPWSRVSREKSNSTRGTGRRGRRPSARHYPCARRCLTLPGESPLLSAHRPSFLTARRF